MNKFTWVSSKHINPAYKVLRQELAVFYRKLRKENRLLANFYWQTNRDAVRAIDDMVMYGICFRHITYYEALEKWPND